MADRYSNVTVVNRYDGKQVYQTSKVNNYPVSDNDVYIIADDKTRLDLLAFKYYKDSSLWYVIAQANNIKGTMYATGGSQIRIPSKI
jgi:nucleoid-associated protein YgaU